jgi:hypothetical protein
MQPSISHQLQDIDRALAIQASQVPFALALALTRTAQDGREELRDEMRASFHQPTPYTLNSPYLKPATKQDLTALIGFKDGFGTEPSFLEPQVHGGERPLKRFEQLMVRAGYMRRDERAVPGEGATLDQYGNMGRGQIQRILSQLHAFNLAGASQNATGSRRSRASRSAEAYFVSHGPGSTRYSSASPRSAWKNGLKEQHLPRGIWLRRQFASGTAIKPVILFVTHAIYARRLNLQAVAERTVAHFPAHFAAAWKTALRTAR